MVRYSDELIEEIRSNNDIVDIISQYVVLKRSGRNYFGLCPFHKEKSPSFSVSPDKQIFHCFGCGAGGNVFHFISKIENTNFIETIQTLADRAGIPLPSLDNGEDTKTQILKSKVYEINEIAAQFYHENLYKPTSKLAQDYVKKRKLDNKTLKAFTIGYSCKYNELYQELKRRGYGEEEILASSLVIKNQDGTYTLNNPITINKSSWLSDYEKYNNYFICPEFNNSSCANIIQIVNSTNTNFNDAKHEKYIYGNDIEYKNGTYTLKDTFASDSWALDYNEISKKYHYTCLNTTGTCTDVNYIYLYDIEGPKYIILSNGDNVEDAKSKMFANNTDSHIKTYIDSWYENNLKRYSAMIEDSPYCFNREIYFSSLKSKDFNFSESENIGGLAYGDYGKFYDYAFKNLNNIEEEPTEDEWRQIISKIDFSCTNKNDIFSVRDKNGNGKLKYPIGMLSFSDILKTNNLFFASEEDISFLNSGGSDYFIVPTGLYAGVAIQITYNLETNIGYQESGVRPVITVKVGAEVVSGNGDAMNPFVLNEEYLTDSTTGTEAINLISFTIDDNLFYAEKEMTWSEWIESEYNTIGATTTSSNDFIYTYRGSSYYEHKAICTVKNNIYTYMTKNDVVKPNVSYIISHLGAGN